MHIEAPISISAKCKIYGYASFPMQPRIIISLYIQLSLPGYLLILLPTYIPAAVSRYDDRCRGPYLRTDVLMYLCQYRNKGMQIIPPLPVIVFVWQELSGFVHF